MIEGYAQVLCKAGSGDTPDVLIEDFQLCANSHLNLETSQESSEFFTLQDLGVAESDLKFVSTESQLTLALDVIKEFDEIGLDCEFKPGYIPGEESQTQILQLACGKHCFVFDVQYFKTNPTFLGFLKSLLEDTDIKKLGFDFKGDLRSLVHTLEVKKIEIHNLFDIQNVGESLLGKKRSLSEMTLQIFGKKLSKFEQCSDWSIRPLRVSQLRYGAKDAILMLRLFDHFKVQEGFDETWLQDNDVIF